MDGNFIFEMEDFISKELCEDIIQRFENEPRKEQSTIKDPNHKVILDLERRNSIQIYLEDMKDTAYIEHDLRNKFKDALDIYKKKFCDYFKRYGENPDFINHVMFSGRPFELSDFIVQRVKPETHFRWHTDEHPRIAHTCIIYLNDLELSDGGATEFACGRKVQPKAGKLLLFPGGWSNVHRGCLVHKHKYMIVNETKFKLQNVGLPFLTSGVKIQKTPIYLASNHESKPNRDSQNSTLVKVPES
jgi:hypothetical protein